MTESVFEFTPDFRRIRTTALLALALLACAATGHAQDTYPSRPVRLVVGFPPGGGMDLAARVAGARLQAALNTPFVVENRPGATGVIAGELVAKAGPDGYTLLVGAAGQMTMSPALVAKLPYDPSRDFTPITTLALFPLVIAAHPGSPVNSLQELVALAKSRPGLINYSHGGAAHQIAAEMLNQAAGIDLKGIPYKGGAPAVNAAIAGDVPLTVVDIAPALAHIRSGRLRALAVTTAQRSALVPDTPTVVESGVAGVEMVIWAGLFAPARTSAEIVAKLHREVSRAMNAPDMKEKLKGIGMDPGGAAPEQLAAMMKSELAKYTAIIRSANIKAE